MQSETINSGNAPPFKLLVYITFYTPNTYAYLKISKQVFSYYILYIKYICM